MSAPPTSSPLTKTWGIVGQPESAESSWRKRGSGRISTAVTGAPAPRRAASARCEFPQAAKFGVPFMKSVTGSDSMSSEIWLRRSLTGLSFRLDPEFVDGAVGKRGREGVVDELVLVDQRQALEARARDVHLEVVAAARPVEHRKLRGVGKCLLEKCLQGCGGHCRIVAREARGAVTVLSRFGHTRVRFSPLRSNRGGGLGT